MWFSMILIPRSWSYDHDGGSDHDPDVGSDHDPNAISVYTVENPGIQPSDMAVKTIAFLNNFQLGHFVRTVICIRFFWAMNIRFSEKLNWFQQAMLSQHAIS